MCGISAVYKYTEITKEDLKRVERMGDKMRYRGPDGEGSWHDEPLPIGVPCRNSDVLILVDRQRLAKQGEQGELCVRGSSLALGYYNNPEKTVVAFIQNPLQKHYPETIYCTGDIV